MMEEAVEDGHHQGGVTAHELTPLAQTLVGGNHGRPLLVACGHQFIEDGADLGVDGEIAELVQDEQVAADQGLQQVVDGIAVGGSHNLVGQLLRGHEAHPVAQLDHLCAQGDGQMGFAQAAGSDQDQGLGLLDKGAVKEADHDRALEFRMQG